MGMGKFGVGFGNGFAQGRQLWVFKMRGVALVPARRFLRCAQVNVRYTFCAEDAYPGEAWGRLLPDAAGH